MIPMPSDATLVLFLSFPLLVTSVLALYYNFRSLHRKTREKESIYECAECLHVYAIARNRPMDHCPKCGYLNDAVRT